MLFIYTFCSYNDNPLSIRLYSLMRYFLEYTSVIICSTMQILLGSAVKYLLLVGNIDTNGCGYHHLLGTGLNV